MIKLNLKRGLDLSNSSSTILYTCGLKDSLNISVIVTVYVCVYIYREKEKGEREREDEKTHFVFNLVLCSRVKKGSVVSLQNMVLDLKDSALYPSR